MGLETGVIFHWEVTLNKWRLWSYSASLAIMITAVAFSFYRSGGELLAWPGLVMEVLANGLLLLLVPNGDDYIILPPNTYLIFNVIIYACIFYIILAFVQKVRTKSM